MINSTNIQNFYYTAINYSFFKSEILLLPPYSIHPHRISAATDHEQLRNIPTERYLCTEMLRGCYGADTGVRQCRAVNGFKVCIIMYARVCVRESEE